MKRTQKKVVFTASLMLMFFETVSCYKHTRTENPYGLEIISDVLEYHQKVTADPNKELVDIENLIPGIVLDIRYASKNNFVQQSMYGTPKAFVRKPVGEALFNIQKELNSKGIGLKIFDAYRPYSVTVKFYEIYPDTTFVAPPWNGSIHNTGCAVDVSLLDLNTGIELEMPTQFDDFTEMASHSYMDLSPIVRQNRTLLREVMVKYGFTPYDFEWWHYNFKGWEKFELMDISFDKLK